MILTNTLDGGTAGVGVSVGNSGASGSPFTAVAGLTYVNNPVMHGALAMQATGGAGDGLTRWAVGGAATMATRFYVRSSAAITSDQGFMRLSHTTDTTAGTLYVTSTGFLRLRDKAGTVNPIWTASDPFPVNQWVRIEVYSNIGTSTSTGTARVAYYLGDSTTPIQDSGTVTGRNLGGDMGVYSMVRIGKLNTDASPTFTFDSLEVRAGADATGLIGPYVAPTLGKVWNGTAWADIVSLTAWDGSMWRPGVKVWTGTAWL